MLSLQDEVTRRLGRAPGTLDFPSRAGKSGRIRAQAEAALMGRKFDVL
jgi:hypothetical protein